MYYDYLNKNHVLITSFLNLDENNQKFIIKKLTKKETWVELISI